MPDSNGTGAVNDGLGLPSVIEYNTASGVIIHITPLSLFTIQAIVEQSKVVHPYPDETPYREASDLVASGFIPASENEEYQALCKAVDEERSQWQNDAITQMACKYPQWGTREQMIAHFRPRLEELRPFVSLHQDDWRNVQEHCVFTGYVDVLDDNNKSIRIPENYRVIRLARQNERIPLSMPEVIDGMRLFRLDLSGATRRGLVGASRRTEKQSAD